MDVCKGCGLLGSAICGYCKRLSFEEWLKAHCFQFYRIR